MTRFSTLAALAVTAGLLSACSGFGNDPFGWFDERTIPSQGMGAAGAMGGQQSMNAAPSAVEPAAGSTAAAVPQPASAERGDWPLKTAQTSAGEVLVDQQGMTLYTFDKDAEGSSACVGECAAKWPPVLAADDAQASGEFTIVTRNDNSKQWAYKGRPLYRWAQDKQQGDVSGDKVGGVWHLATP
jgi:predicted lipoprotein with Yx(FWY)xxD motif